MKRTVEAVIVDAFQKIADDDLDLEMPAALLIVDELRAEGYLIVERVR